MSYVFDTLATAIRKLEKKLTGKDKEILSQIGWALEEIHSKNHDLKDIINHDSYVTEAVNRLKEIMKEGE